MPTVIGRHTITKDARHWLNSPKRAELFGALGVTNIRTFVDPRNPTRVALMLDVPDMDALATAMTGKQAADAMAHDGVVPESLVIQVESKARGGVPICLVRAGRAALSPREKKDAR